VAVTLNPQTTLPDDLAAVVRALDDVDRDARALIEPLDDAQFNWQPVPNRAWSVAQCLDHLARINTLYLAALEAGVERARRAGLARRRPISLGFAVRAFIRSLDAPPRLRLPAWPDTIPASRGAKDATWAAFVASQDRVRALARTAGDVDLNRARYRNPLAFGIPFPVGVGLHVIAAHDRRHVWQAGQVCKRPGFPAS
jgi:hypothetical protein